MLTKFFSFLIGKNNLILLKSFFPKKRTRELIEKRRDFYSQFLESGDIYYDVGANYGNRIEPIINSGIKIVAVEPQELCIDYLRKKYGNKIELVTEGLGEKEGVMKMYIADAHTISSFSKEWIDATKKSGRFSQQNWDETRDIKITTLDILIEKFGKPRFIKIDVEGFEAEVLSGLSVPVEMISFEYTVPERLESVSDCLQHIKNIGDDKNVYNYSVGESMKWELDEWLDYDKMLVKIESAEFINSDFGDIYARYQN